MVDSFLLYLVKFFDFFSENFKRKSDGKKGKKVIEIKHRDFFLKIEE